jgi:hypothetical protein
MDTPPQIRLRSSGSIFLETKHNNVEYILDQKLAYLAST